MTSELTPILLQLLLKQSPLLNLSQPYTTDNTISDHTQKLINDQFNIMLQSQLVQTIL
jgi:hypothetical protein